MTRQKNSRRRISIVPLNDDEGNADDARMLTITMGKT